MPVLALVCLYPGVGAALALGMGVAVALLAGNPYLHMTRQYTSRLLAASVVGLGAGMNLETVLQAGFKGLGYTVVSIMACLLTGLLLGRLFKVEREASLLIAVGTAICGGSAIAAVAPVIQARAHNISVALAVVFCLNALALLVFPFIGHYFELTQAQFGLWAALAIHDTSSVVGAGLNYGPEALQIATTVKLARALWIVPVAVAVGYFYKADGAEAGAQKRKYPWFILGFLAMATLVTWVPQLAAVGQVVSSAARQLLVLTLFCIGANLTRESLRQVGARPLVQGVVLWLVVSAVSLLALHYGVLS